MGSNWKFDLCSVAPHAGAWIEMKGSQEETQKEIVAPHAGAWIEITTSDGGHLELAVAPTRKRGLK